MRVAYFEMVGGASGNMLLGALIDAGADPVAIERGLRTIPVDGWTFERTRAGKCGIDAAYVDFAIAGEDGAPGVARAHGRRLAEIVALVDRSALSSTVRERAASIYRRLAEAEAKVHGSTVETIHFHEVGQTDAILDVAGVCLALELLDVERVMCSAFPLGNGSISMHHGRYPNPPPATAELLLGAPTQPLDIEGELVTTTAAAILMTLVRDPGLRPAMRFERIGYGAGRSNFAVPNVTRAIVGEAIGEQPAAAHRDGLERDEVIVLETNLDDMNPQGFELAFERIFAAGALDVWTAPIGMKKGRPALLLSALAAPPFAAACAQAMLVETSSLGIRTRREARTLVAREIVRRVTPYGEVRLKVAQAADWTRATLEYDDVVRIARERGLPFATVAGELHPLVESIERHEPELV